MAKKRDKQLLLYQAALKVFARYGFHRARLEDIADELGMKKASLYTYIKNKQELYEKTIENALLDWQKTAKDACFRLDDPVDQLTMTDRFHLTDLPEFAEKKAGSDEALSSAFEGRTQGGRMAQPFACCAQGR